MSFIEKQLKPSLSEEDEACVYAMQLAYSQILPVVLNTAVELELFDIIAGAGPGAHISASEVASNLPTQNPDAPSMLEHMMDLLTSHSLLTCSIQSQEDGKVERLYGLAPAAKFFAKNQDEGFLTAFFQFSNHPATKDLLFQLKDTILGGGNLYGNAFGMTIFQLMKNDPSLSRVFNKGMSDYSVIFMKKILEKYKGFEGLTSLVDVGGGNGTTLHMIIAKYPCIKGLNFDLPQVVKDAPSYPGIEHVGGDMFLSIPKADAVMVKFVCHDWNDEDCLKILKNCYEALPEGGKVIVMEYLRPNVPDSTTVGKYMSGIANVMLMTIGGKERMEKEFEALCKGSGFSDFRVICNAYAIWVMEFCK